MNKLPSLLNFDIKPPPQKVEMVIEEVDTDTGENNPNFIYDEKDDEIDELQETQKTLELEFVKKPEMIEDEIFADAPPKKRGTATRSTTPKKRTRKPLSEEDKEKRRDALARGRETRARNLAKKKALLEQQDDLETQEQQLNLEDKQLDLEIQNAKLNKKAKKVKKVIIQDSSSEEEEIQYVKKSKKKARELDLSPVRSSITAEDIERSQLNTLMAYEKLRKDRKDEKKRVKQIEQQQAHIKKTMAEVNNSWGRGAGKYSGMLSGMGL